MDSQKEKRYFHFKFTGEGIIPDGYEYPCEIIKNQIDREILREVRRQCDKEDGQG